MEKIREKLIRFVTSQKDAPLLAGLSIGIYFMLLYYGRNFGLANSAVQVLFFTAYYILMPMAALYLGYRLLKIFKAAKYRKYFLFVAMVGFFACFMLQITSGSFFNPTALIYIAAAAVLGFWISRYYKLVILMVFFMCLFNLKPLAGIAYAKIVSSNGWKKLPDDIENITLKKRPNIYYIQPDGYTSFENLRNNKYYRFDNSDYEQFLRDNDFKLYDDYRSNYGTTLLSNSSAFSMRHHFLQRDVAKFAARSVIMENNPVLRILKKNGYTTNFLAEAPYLIVNRSFSGYDYCNFSPGEISLFGDGISPGNGKDIFGDLKARMKNQKPSGNFYFIEKFLPGHVTGRSDLSRGAADEADKHMKYLMLAKKWLKETVAYICANDPTAIVIIGADHGGYAGFSNTHESFSKITDADLVKSIFGAQLAIRWNDNKASQYDGELKSGVNLFRTVFSLLADDKKYIENTEDNSSFVELGNPKVVYRYIDNNGKVVFEKK